MNNTALPFASPSSCPGPDPCPSSTPTPNGGAYAPLPLGKDSECDPAPIPAPGSGCIGEDELVDLANGESKRAGDVLAGDTVVGISANGSLSPQSVASVSRSIQPCLRIEAGEHRLVCSESHLLMTSLTDSITADSVTLGTVLMDATGSPVEVSQVLILDQLPVVTWTCHPDHTYCASGLLNHNKVNVVVPPGELSL
jgi:hypothetical protein